MIEGSPSAPATEILVEVTRGPEMESRHRGALAVADPQGRLIASCGDPDLATYVRSAAKPFQALALYESAAMERFRITEEELAVVIASHSGEPLHLDLVRSLQARSGVREEWLRCGPQAPFDPPTRQAMQRAGETPTAMHNNCSGKHTGMLAAALALGAPVDSYLDPSHPVQMANRRRLAIMTGLEPEQIGLAIDGCSAPTFRLPLSRFARAFARLAAAGTAGSDEMLPGLRAAWKAMVGFPAVIAGTRERLDTALMIAAREAGISLVAKAGAEGTYAIGAVTPTGPIGIALKIEDGGERARNSVAVETLAQLGLLPPGMADRVRDYHRPAVRSLAGARVGGIEPVFRLRLH